jgi:hypothetical protein
VDPDGAALEYKWMLLSKPAGSTLTSGTIFCQAATCTLGPLTPGLHVVGLWVVDEAGVTSPQDAAAVWVE